MLWEQEGSRPQGGAIRHHELISHRVHEEHLVVVRPDLDTVPPHALDNPPHAVDEAVLLVRAGPRTRSTSKARQPPEGGRGNCPCCRRDHNIYIYIYTYICASQRFRPSESACMARSLSRADPRPEMVTKSSTVGGPPWQPVRLYTRCAFTIFFSCPPEGMELRSSCNFHRRRSPVSAAS